MENSLQNLAYLTNVILNPGLCTTIYTTLLTDPFMCLLLIQSHVPVMYFNVEHTV